MPLKSGSSPETISENIREFHHGDTFAHTVAQFGKKDADRQAVAVAMETARKSKRKRKRGGRVHVGPIIGDTGGRADKVNMNVPSGAYIIPSDVVSGLGEGNTLHGMKIIERMFPHPKGSGGTSKGEPVPIAAAHGEVSISPEQLKAKFGDIDHAHKIMDHWVVHERKNIIHTMSRLPGPAQD
jgi:hypothetical protein